MQICAGERSRNIPLERDVGPFHCGISAARGGSTTAAKLPDLPNPAPLPCGSGREIWCYTHSFPGGRWDMGRGMVLGAVRGDLEGVQAEIGS